MRSEIRLESDGQSRQVRLSRRMSTWLWADLPAGALTGLLGAVTFPCDECDLNYVAGVFTSMAPLIVDLVTGRALRLPSTISVTLAPAGSRGGWTCRSRLPALDGQPAADPGAAADGLTPTVSVADSPSPSVHPSARSRPSCRRRARCGPSRPCDAGAPLRKLLRPLTIRRERLRRPSRRSSND